MDLTTDATALPSGRFSGNTLPGNGRWKNNQLYLMSFEVEGGGKLSHYDVVIEHAPNFQL